MWDTNCCHRFSVLSSGRYKGFSRKTTHGRCPSQTHPSEPSQHTLFALRMHALSWTHRPEPRRSDRRGVRDPAHPPRGKCFAPVTEKPARKPSTPTETTTTEGEATGSADENRRQSTAHGDKEKGGGQAAPPRSKCQPARTWVRLCVAQDKSVLVNSIALCAIHRRGTFVGVLWWGSV